MENSFTNFKKKENKTNELKETKLSENIKSLKMRNYLNANQTRDKYHMRFKNNSSTENFEDEYNNPGYKTNYLSGSNNGDKDSNFKTGTNFYKSNFNNTVSSPFSAFNKTTSHSMKTKKNNFYKTASDGLDFQAGSFPKTVYKEKEIITLFSLYHMNNQKITENNIAINNVEDKDEIKELYSRFDIKKAKEIETQIDTIKVKLENKKNKTTTLDKALGKFNKHQIRCPESFFNDPTKSLLKLKMNNEVFQRVMSSREYEQCESYDTKIREDFHTYILLMQMNKIKESEKVLKNPNINKELDEFTSQLQKSQFKKQQSFSKRVSRKYLLENIILNNIMKDVKSKPRARCQFTLNLLDDKLFLFGGLNSDKLCDFWVCNIKDNYQWQQIVYNEESEPVPRYGHTSVLYKNELYVYGGTMPSKYFKSSEELIIFSTSSNSFYEPKISNKNIVPNRRNHIAIAVGYHMLIHGGIGLYDKVLSDSLVFDLPSRRWGILEIDGKNPPPLAFHSVELILSSDKMCNPGLNILNIPDTPIHLRASKLKIEGIYFFGGMDGDRNYTNDVRILSIGKKPLKWIYPEIDGVPPVARINATMNYFPDIGIMIIFGGRNDKRDIIFNEIYILDLYNLNWIRTKSDPVLECRTEHSSLIYGDKLIILGGNDACKYKKNDFLIIDLDLYNYKKVLEKNLEKAARVVKNSQNRLNEKTPPIVNFEKYRNPSINYN